MEKAYLSPHWHRVATLRLRLRAHVRFHRTEYRGGLWYVLQDRVSGRFHRLAPETHYFISLLDGNRTVQQAWDIAAEHLQDDVLTQDEAIRLIGQLHAADVLCGETPPDFAEMVTRGRRQRRRKLMMSMLNPLALRLPLFDPEEFLRAVAPLARLMFSSVGLVLYLAITLWAGVEVVLHWEELTSNIADRVLATENLMLLLLAYPFVKALHELGHALAVKRWGGEVHEIGVMFLVFLPVPYVDASDSMAFPEKWRRALVGAAGILVELLLASIAALVWINAEDGMVSAFAFAVMLIGGISTLLFNGNPLLKFDGYYVLSDLIEIPNLAQRSNQYLGYLVQRHAFGVEDAQNPATARGEAPWFVFYSLASFAYRVFILFVIALFVGTQFFFLGVVLALWSVMLMFGVPGFKMLKFLVSSPALRRRRGRAYGTVAGAAAVLAVLLLTVPLPHATIAEGVVWPDDASALVAGEDGYVTALAVPDGAEVAADAVILRIEDPGLLARERVLTARVSELDRRLAVLDLTRPAEARIAAEERRQAMAERDRLRDRLAEKELRGRVSGRLVMAEGEDILGRFVRKGEVLGHIVSEDRLWVRMVIPEESADFALANIRGLELRFASAPAATDAALLLRVMPTLSTLLPSLALSTEGGGSFSLDPSDPQRQRALARLLHLDAVPMTAAVPARIGERAWLRIRHDPEPVARRLYRSARQVFLRHFAV